MDRKKKGKIMKKELSFFSSSFSFLIIFLFLTSQLFFILSSIDGKIFLNNFLKRIELLKKNNNEKRIERDDYII